MKVALQAAVPRWADVVFHVLAHLRADGLPSALYSRWYVSFAAQALGPVSQRALGQDLSILSVLLSDHVALAAVQALAWLWTDSDAALACADKELGDLCAIEVADERVLRALRARPQAAEVLRCAALLEAAACHHLPLPRVDAPGLADTLGELLAYAPGLRDAVVTPMRCLTVHGRVRGASIYVGVPGEGVTLEHVAVQAAHEATVGEVLAQPTSLSERQVEQVALVLLHARICRSRWAAAHRSWCGQAAVGDVHLQASALSAPQQTALEACLQRAG